MLDRDPALRNVIRDANLDAELSDLDATNLEGISVGEGGVNVLDYNVFYLFTIPSENQRVKGNILLLHDQTNTSTIWSRIGTLQTFAAYGYRCWAPDLPGAGHTSGADECDDERERAPFVDAFVGALGVKELILVACSMAGRYLVPLLCQKRPRQFYLAGIVAIAISDTNRIEQSDTSPYDIRTPCLVLRGEWDTSLGLSAADSLARLPHARVVVVKDGKHLCHQSHPDVFHRVTLNFFDVVARHVTKKSIFVTEL